MRKVNVFGKKISQVSTIYVIVFLFAIIFALRTWMLSVQTEQLESLQADELILERELNQLLESEQEEIFHPIGEIVTAFPLSVNLLDIDNELLYLKHASGMAFASVYQYEIIVDADNPFEESLPSSVKFIEIRFDITTNDVSHITHFIDLMIELDRIYYIDSLDVSLNDGEIITSIIVYTFYNPIVIPS